MTPVSNRGINPLPRVRNAKGKASGFGGCYRCGDTWNWKQEHQTPYRDNAGGGCFPLCQECWTELTPDERLPFYRELWLDWVTEAHSMNFGGRDEYVDELAEKWTPIKAAVLSGL